MDLIPNDNELLVLVFVGVGGVTCVNFSSLRVDVSVLLGRVLVHLLRVWCILLGFKNDGDGDGNGSLDDVLDVRDRRGGEHLEEGSDLVVEGDFSVEVDESVARVLLCDLFVVGLRSKLKSFGSGEVFVVLREGGSNQRERKRESVWRDEGEGPTERRGEGEDWNTHVVNSRLKLGDGVLESQDLGVVRDDSVEGDLSNVERESERVGFDELRAEMGGKGCQLGEEDETKGTHLCGAREMERKEGRKKKRDRP